ncbi:MAG: hypothetical protein JXN61_06750, partial [Sedimentisphaerales bacterium]|nr:hypothetical protein [Sedimentisphaerales bacterium]
LSPAFRHFLKAIPVSTRIRWNSLYHGGVWRSSEFIRGGPGGVDESGPFGCAQDMLWMGGLK